MFRKYPSELYNLPYVLFAATPLYKILKSIPFELFLVWAKHVTPAQTRKENLAMLTGMKMMIPAPAFEKMTTVLQASVSANEYYELMTELGKLPAKAA